MSLRDFFPFKTIRPSQERALQTIEDAVAAGKRYIVIEAPTGVGKSGIAEAVARWAAAGYAARLGCEDQAGAYILSTQKSLTEQYMKDFGAGAWCDQGLVEMRGRANFTCIEGAGDCASGKLLGCEESEKPLAGNGDCDPTQCPYKLARKEFMLTPTGVTNFAYFLASTAYAGDSFPRRTFLIVDECHNAEKELLGFFEVELNTRRTQELGIASFPDIKPNEKPPVRAWLEEVFLPMAAEKIREYLGEAMKWKTLDMDQALRYRRRASGLEETVDKMVGFLSAPETDWFVYVDKDRDGVPERMIFKRLSAADIAEPLLFKKGSFVLLMSATILDTTTFLRNLGVRAADAVVLRLDSEFPIANRPVFYWGAGDMRHACIEKSLPKVVQRVADILDRCPTVKGIIHTHSYKITQAVVAGLQRTPHARRVITHTNEKGAREAAILRHRTSPEPTVLVSPSMYEGLDLKGDLSRFQIICKVPYPALDPYIKARMERDAQWYTLQAGLSLIQATGRSVRTSDDWAYTFILDGGFARFFTQNSYLLSPWWTNSVAFVREPATIEAAFAGLLRRQQVAVA